jgi:hypothetical protein
MAKKVNRQMTKSEAKELVKQKLVKAMAIKKMTKNETRELVKQELVKAMGPKFSKTEATAMKAIIRESEPKPVTPVSPQAFYSAISSNSTSKSYVRKVK